MAYIKLDQMNQQMTLELELLTDAWDNYKKNIVERASDDERVLTSEELDVETAINALIGKNE